MTTNESHAQYRFEYYDIADAEESDPDPAFVAYGDNTDDCETALAKHLNLPNDDDIRLTWIFNDDGDADAYKVVSIDEDAVLGVVYVTVEKEMK